MPKKGKKKVNPRTPSAKPKKSKVVKAKKTKASRNPKQTTRRIPAQVGQRSRANITEVVAPDGSRGGVGAYARRRTPEEIQAERVAQARATLGINDFPQPVRQAQRTAPRRVQEPVGGFTGLTSGYGITQNKTKELEGKLNDMEARLKAEIEKQNQPNNPAQDPAQEVRPQRQRQRAPVIRGRQPIYSPSTTTADLERAQRKYENDRTAQRGRDARKHARAEIFQPLPITEEGERRGQELEEEKRVQDIRDELDRQTKQVEAQSTISRILKDANDKVKEKERIQKQADAEKRLVKLSQVKKPEPEPESPPQEKFKVGGEIEVPFSSQEELLQAYRNRPNQPKPIDMTPQPRTDIPQPTPLTATEPLFLQDPESRKKVLGDDDEGFDTADEFDEEKDKRIEEIKEEIKAEKQVEKDATDIFEELEGLDDDQFIDVSEIEPQEAPPPQVNLQHETRSKATSQREKPRENDPQNLLNVSSLRKNIVDSFGQASLKKLREEQAEEEKKKEETRRQKAERERLRTRPLPPTPQREDPPPPPPKDVPEPSKAREVVGEVIDDVVDRAFDTATENAKRLEKERKEKQRKDREEERKRISREATQSLIGAGIRGAVDTQQRRDRGQQRQQRDKQKRSNTLDVGDIVDDLVDRSIVEAQSKETQVRASGQGRRGTDIEAELRKFRKSGSSGGAPAGDPDSDNPFGFDPDRGGRSEDEVNRLRERLEARQLIQDEKNKVLGALMNFGVNGQYIPFNARDLIRITNTANDRQLLNVLRDLIRDDRRPEVRKLEKEIMDLAQDLLRLKKDEKTESNKIAKLKKK